MYAGDGLGCVAEAVAVLAAVAEDLVVLHAGEGVLDAAPDLSMLVLPASSPGSRARTGRLLCGTTRPVLMGVPSASTVTASQRWARPEFRQALAWASAVPWRSLVWCRHRRCPARSPRTVVARGRSVVRSRTGTRAPCTIHSRSIASLGREAELDREQRPRRLNDPADRCRRAAEQRRELPPREVRPRIQRLASERYLELVARADLEVIEDDAFHRLMDPARSW